jgi:hypothetical protein
MSTPMFGRAYADGRVAQCTGLTIPACRPDKVGRVQCAVKPRARLAKTYAVGADAVGADAVGADAVGADAVGADAVVADAACG